MAFSRSLVIASLSVLLAAGMTGQSAEAASAKKAASYDAQCVSTSAPRNVRAGETFSVGMRVKNAGKNEWTKKDIGVRVTVGTTGTHNVALSKNVKANKTQNSVLLATAPTTAGTHELTWRMTNKNTAFGQTCRATFTVKSAIRPSSSSSKTSSSASNQVSSAASSVTSIGSSASSASSSVASSVASTSSVQSSSAQNSAQLPAVTAFFEYALMGGPSIDAVVKNQKNVAVMAFVAQSGGAETVLTKASFRAVQGSLLNARNYSLWVDTDKNGTVDTVLKGNVAPAADLVTFDALAYVTAVEGDIRFEVHADVSSSLVNDRLQLDFAADTPIEAKRVSDATPVKVIRWGNVAATLFTIRNQGDLFVTKNVTPLRSHQLLGGTLGESILMLTFRAQYEDIDVTDLQLTTFASNGSSVDRLELYFAGAMSPFAIATVGGCGSDQVPTTDNGIAVQTFCANTESRQLVIAKDTTKDVVVRPRIKTDDQGATSGQIFGIFVHENNQINNATGVGAVRARGLASSNDLLGNDNDALAEGEVFVGTGAPAANVRIKGESNTVVLSKLASITNGDTNPNNTKLQHGAQKIGAFTFTAAQNFNTLNGVNRWTLNGVIIKTVLTNVLMEAHGFGVYNAADPSMKAPCALVGITGVPIAGPLSTFVSGGGYLQCADLKAAGLDTSVYPGGQMTLVVEGNVMTINEGAQVQASIQRFNDSSYQDKLMAAGRNIEWFDEDVNQTTHRWVEYNVPTPNNAVDSTMYVQ